MPITKRADSWIEKNQAKIVREEFRTHYNSETIYDSKHGEGLLLKIEIAYLIADDNLEDISSLRMLLRCMSENRPFSTSKFPEPDVNDGNKEKYFIHEFSLNEIRQYKVLSIQNLDLLIEEYLSGHLILDIDFDEFADIAFNDPESQFD